MTLDPDKIRESIEAGIQRLVGALDEQVRTLVDELWEATTQERDEAVKNTRSAVEFEAEQAVATAIAKVRAEAQEEFTAAVAPVQREVEVRHAELERLRVQVDTYAAELVRVREELSQKQVEPAVVGVLPASRLIESIRHLDAAGSLTDVLTGLSTAVAAEAPRYLILIMRAGQAIVWKAGGFDQGSDPRQAAVTLDDRSLVGTAIRRSEACQFGPGLDAPVPETGLPFASLAPGKVGLAVPVLVGDRAVAVVYADDAGSAPGADASAWPAAVEVFARYAGRCLESLTVSRAAKPATVSRSA